MGVPNESVPAFTDAGPTDARAPTAELLGNAACNCEIPLGVGVTNGAEDSGCAPVRVCSQFPEPKNHSLSLLIGPPRVPPQRLSTYRGTWGAMQPVDGL